MSVQTDFVAQLVSLGKSGKITNPLKDLLFKLGDRNVPADKARALEGLRHLDMVKNSIPYMFLVDALANDSGIDVAFIQHASAFLVACSVDVRRYAKRFVRLCTRFQKQTQLGERPDLAIEPLKRAVGKLNDSPNIISPIHPLLFQSCLLVLDLQTPMRYLSPDVCEINPTLNKLTIRDFLLYCYYGGRVLIGMRMYKEALELLLQAITAPTTSISAITMAAYKKYMLVSLIHKGKCGELPAYTSQAVHRGLRTHCAEYKTLAEECERGNIQQFWEPNNLVRKACLKDQNETLLDLVLQNQTKRDILKLTDTYMTMSMEQISQIIQKSPEETELILLRMIEAGEIVAQIDDVEGLVSFQDAFEVQAPAIAERIDFNIQETLRLAAKVKEMDHQVSCEAFLTKANKPQAPIAEDLALRQGIEASLADQ